MKNNLFKISNEEYMDKVNDSIIDGTFDEYNLFILNEFLKSKREEPKDYFDFPPEPTIYDHDDEFRLPILNGECPKLIECNFTSPYVDVESIPSLIKKPWINQDYKIYLANPRLYRYHALGTVSLAHVKDLDKKYYKGKTDYCVSCINDYMMEATGEPLFYLI